MSYQLNDDRLDRVRRILARFSLYPNVLSIWNPVKMAEWIKVWSRMGLADLDTVLDLGCGRGTQAMMISRHAGTVVGVDPAIEDVDAANERVRRLGGFQNVKFIEGDAYSFGKEWEGYFTTIVSLSVLEHIDQWELVLNKLFELLKPGGHLIMAVDGPGVRKHSAINESYSRNHQVQVAFDSELLGNALVSSGFSVEYLEGYLGSEYSHRLFVDGVARRFVWPKPACLVHAIRLMVDELLLRGREPMELIVVCSKPMKESVR